MLAITHTAEDLRLLEAAEIAESSNAYDQRVTGRGCGSPACMLGGYGWARPDSAIGKVLRWGSDFSIPLPTHFDVLDEFGINGREHEELFGSYGCGNAGTDGKKAAAYVREFVRERAEARLR